MLEESANSPFITNYEGRLGNIEPGDALLYRGRGYIQLTGRTNYAEMGKKIGIDLEAAPELLSSPDLAARVAILYLATRSREGQNGLQLANAGETAALRRLINGGTRDVDRILGVLADWRAAEVYAAPTGE